MSNFDINNYKYTPLFCEENIWKLIETLYMNNDVKPKDVLFIINKSKTIALFDQALSSNNQPVIWDYHVILTAEIDLITVIFDFDSKCKFPVNITEYFNKTFQGSDTLHETYRPLIKVINAQYYFEHFFSDRLHMKGLIKSHQYPDYVIIRPAAGSKILSLENCLDVSKLSDGSILYKPEQYLTLNK